MPTQKPNIRSFFILLLAIGFGVRIFGQSVDLEALAKSKLLKVSGNVAANAVYFNPYGEVTGREPFTYNLQGTLNVGILQFSMPISYTYTYMGDTFTYQNPFKFNRLSLHPKYKWVTAHIGDATMTFSPYTLNGHPFTGGGIELTPQGKFKIAAFAGRLLRATPDNSDPQTIPAFNRMGYGSKLEYAGDKWQAGVIVFYAKDNLHSLDSVSEYKKVLPKENLVVSLKGGVKVKKDLNIKAEYAGTTITQDLRASAATDNSSPFRWLFNNRSSTEYYTAFNVAVDYRIGKNVMGVKLEHIDPGYQTLGGYYFTNDLQNITLNTTTVLFQNKVNLSFNIGYERDNLNHQKQSASSRQVGTINIAYNPSSRFTLAGMYSNFTTFTNTKVNQFDNINDNNLLDNYLDELDYKQLSQNANFNVNYVLSQKKESQQNINLNYALADVANEQNGIVRVGEASTFHNLSSAYSLYLKERKINLGAGFNGTLNTIGTQNSVTWGPMLSLGKKFWSDKLNTNFSVSYNQTQNLDQISKNMGIRARAVYIYEKKHNFNLNAVQVFTQTPTQNKKNLTVTFGYNYAFDLNAPKIKLPEHTTKVKTENEKKTKELLPENNTEKSVTQTENTTETLKIEIAKTDLKKKYSDKKEDTEKTHPNTIKIKHTLLNMEADEVHVENALKDLRKKLNEDESLYLIKDYNKKMDSLEASWKNESKKEDFKKKAEQYLKTIEENRTKMLNYNRLLTYSIKTLYEEARVLNLQLENTYNDIQAKVNSSPNPDPKDLEFLKLKKAQYEAHFWMLKELEKMQYENVIRNEGIIKEFNEKYFNTFQELINLKKNDKEIEEKMIILLADFMHQKSRGS